MSLNTITTPLISVLIVTYNSARYTERCFSALIQQTYPNFEVIVLDNCSGDGGPVLPSDERFRLIQSDTNLGFAAGNNRAAALARGTWLATLNPDAFPEPDWLVHLLNATTLIPNVTMVGSLQVDANDPSLLDGAGDCYHAFGIAWRGLYGHPISKAPPTGEVFGPCAAAALYNTEAFREVGGFDEDFFCYHEDVDLALRLRLIGGRCVQSADARVAHVGSGITGLQSDFSVYHGVRNRIWTFFKSMPLPLMLLLTPPFAAAQVYLLVRTICTRTFKPTLRGMIAGAYGIPSKLMHRAKVQGQRRISSLKFARALTWSIKKAHNREHDIRTRPSA